MKNDVTDRFIECYEYLLNHNMIKDKKSFADAIGVSTSMITEIIKDRSNVGVTALQNTVIQFNINGNWIFSGKGEMLINESNNKNQPEMNCNDCVYKRMFEKLEKNEDWYQKEIDRLNSELSSLRHHDQPERKRHSA